MLQNVDGEDLWHLLRSGFVYVEDKCLSSITTYHAL